MTGFYRGGSAERTDLGSRGTPNNGFVGTRSKEKDFEGMTTAIQRAYTNGDGDATVPKKGILGIATFHTYGPTTFITQSYFQVHVRALTEFHRRPMKRSSRPFRTYSYGGMSPAPSTAGGGPDRLCASTK